MCFRLIPNSDSESDLSLIMEGQKEAVVGVESVGRTA